MITREQIEGIQAESRDRGISIKRLLQEKGIPEHQYFWWKRKYVIGKILCSENGKEGCRKNGNKNTVKTETIVQ